MRTCAIKLYKWRRYNGDVEAVWRRYYNDIKAQLRRDYAIQAIWLPDDAHLRYMFMYLFISVNLCLSVNLTGSITSNLTGSITRHWWLSVADVIEPVELTEP